MTLPKTQGLMLRKLSDEKRLADILCQADPSE